MRLRTFTAQDMNRAMLMVRETLGDDAVIISTSRDSSGKSVSVTAALEEEVASENHAASSSHWLDEDEFDDTPSGGIAQYLAATAKMQGKVSDRRAIPRPAQAKTDPRQSAIAKTPVLKNRDLAYFLHELEQILHFHSVPHVLFEKMMLNARKMNVALESSERGTAHALTALLSQMFRFQPLAVDDKICNERIMLVGPAGVGKTLAAAKICAHRIADRMPVDILTIDNKRAGGVEQLQAFTAIMGLEVQVATSRSELRQCLKETLQGTPLVIDSFGTNPYSFSELKELTDFANLHGIEPVLVLAAGMDAQEASDVVKAFSFLGLKRLLITRLDSTRRLGAVLAAADAGQAALADMTTSGQVAGGFKPFSPANLAQLLMQHKFDHQG